MEKRGRVETKKDVLQLLNIALEHEWAVSFEYTIHAYSMPKGRFFYEDPIMKNRGDVRAQVIQIGIDEMYHSLQLAVIIRQMGGVPSFKTDQVMRYPRIMENLKRDKMTEDMVTDLYQSAQFSEGAFPEIQNMILNISYDEVRHSAQFAAMIDALARQGAQDAMCYQHQPAAANREEVELLHDIMRLENELLHRYLKHVFAFSGHQDLSQRLFKNSIDHMRHWDKNAGILIKWGDVVRIENAGKDAGGVERSDRPMPSAYPGDSRLTALETLIPAEQEVADKYERLISLVPDGDIKEQLKLHLALDREHLYTQTWLLRNVQKIRDL